MTFFSKENILTFPLIIPGSNHVWHLIEQYSSGVFLLRCGLCLIEGSGNYALNADRTGVDFIIDMEYLEIDARDCSEYTSKMRSLILSHSFEINQYNKNYKNCKVCGILGYDLLRTEKNKEIFKNSPLYELDVTQFYNNYEEYEFCMQAFSMTCEEIQITKMLK